MAAERTRRSEPCSHEDCGSRRFYIDQDGYTYCDQGHRQSERGTVVTNDTGELIITGRKQRRVESDGGSIATSRSGFSKLQAYEHYLLCLQLILRKQLAWLIKEKRLPDELELIVRDLWALRVQFIHSGLNNDAETDDEKRSQLFSSQSEGETSTDAEGMSQSAKSKSINVSSKSVTLLDTIALIHAGILLLHLPVCTTDLCQWIKDGQLLYYHSSKAAPVDIRRRLPGYLQRILDPETVLTGQTLHFAVYSIVSKLTTQYGMQFPAINHTLLLYRWLKILALPIEIFAAVQKLTRMLDIDFSYDILARTSVARMPELRLMALIVVATKLLFPADEVERSATSNEHPSALSMDWSAWTIASSTSHDDDDEADDTYNLTFEKAFTATETDCLTMADDQLDQYLDWYQDYIASEHVSERGRAARDADFRRTLLNMFPVGKSKRRIPVVKQDDEDKIAEQRLRHAQSKLMPRPLVPGQNSKARVVEDDVQHRRVGTFYHRYRKMDELLAGPVAAQKLYELAAQRSGVGVELMLRAVLSVEKLLEKQEIALDGRKD